MNWTALKAWAWPLGRTFLAGLLAAATASLTALTNVPSVWIPIVGFGVAALNGLLIAVQKVAPGVPTPVPPTVVPAAATPLPPTTAVTPPQGP